MENSVSKRTELAA